MAESYFVRGSTKCIKCDHAFTEHSEGILDPGVVSKKSELTCLVGGCTCRGFHPAWPENVTISMEAAPLDVPVQEFPEFYPLKKNLFEKDGADVSEPEMVEHPAHYNSGKIEVWDFIVDQDLPYCLGDAVKYICRTGKKDSAKRVQDLEKAKQYIDREIQRIKEEEFDIIREQNIKAINDEFGHDGLMGRR